MKSPLTANVLQVLSLHAPSSAKELLDKACKERGWRATDLTSSQLEQIIPALCAALTSSEAGAEMRGDLRLLLDTDRFRDERIASQVPKPLVYIVEDDEDTRATYEQVLAEAGYDMALAANGDEAWTLLEGESGLRPAAIVLDLMMPVLSGWQLQNDRLAKGARAQAAGRHVGSHAGGASAGGHPRRHRKPLSRTQLLGAVSVAVLR